MRHFIPLIILAVLVACANTHPVKDIGAGTYRLTHTMPSTLPAQGGLNALANMAQTHCAKESGPYTKLSEDTTVSGKTQTVTLTFTCAPVLKSSAYAPAVISATAPTTYAAPINLAPDELLVK